MLNITADATSTLGWLSSATRIAIPVYQREYRWSQAPCQQLLEDIRRVAGAPTGRAHFIGSILAKDEDGDVTLVDGQQRVTTIMLLIAAIRDLAKREGDDLWRQLTALL